MYSIMDGPRRDDTNQAEHDPLNDSSAIMAVIDAHQPGFQMAKQATHAAVLGGASVSEVRGPLAVTDDTLSRVKQIIAGSPVRAAGYRLKVLLIESDKGLSAGEAEIAPTLAKSGFVSKSDNQKSREDRGSDTALIVDVGSAAWCQKQAYGNEPWAKVGMVIKMIRYTGHAYEEPPGSGKRYALINDEDVLGYYEETVNG